MSDNRRLYPVRVDASLDGSLSRGLWLVKWLLLIPHYVVLAFLWLAFVPLSVVAFVAILFTGRYPRALFDFNVGVLRWTWRVHYYGYGALGTDRYPPFTLADVPDYPAHLDVPYPGQLSRGLVLVKWWLLAIPHYLVLALFVGGGMWLGAGRSDDGWAFGGLVGLLVVVAGVVLLFSGRYPTPIYDFVMGMDRWALRVAAYAALMTDEYPPFRMDMGGTDPGSVPTSAPPAGPDGGAAAPLGSGPAPVDAPTVAPDVPAGGPTTSPASTLSAGRVVSAVVGAVLLLMSTGFLAAGGGLLWADQAQRDEAGYVWAPDTTLDTDLYALTTDELVLEGNGLGWVVDDLLGTARFEAVPTSAGEELFLGVARTADVDRYLADVGHEMLGDRWDRGMHRTDSTMMAGGAPSVPPTEIGIWTASASGEGRQVLDWRPTEGSWTVVVMRADGTAGVSADVRVAATLPGLTWFAAILLAVGFVVAAAGALLIALAVRQAHRNAPPGGAPADRLAPPPPVANPDEESALSVTPAARR